MILMLSFVSVSLAIGTLDAAVNRAGEVARQLESAMHSRSDSSRVTTPTFTGSETVDDGAIAWFVYSNEKQPLLTRDIRRLRVEKAVVTHLAAEYGRAPDIGSMDETRLIGRIRPGMQFTSGTEGTVGWTAGYAPSTSIASAFPDKPAVDRESETASLDRISLAVLPFRTLDPDLDEGRGATVAMLLITEIDAPNITVLEREEVGRIVEAKSFAELDVTEDAQGVAMGQLLNARYLLMGTVGRTGSDVVVLTGRIIDAGTGEIVDGHRAAVVGSFDSLFEDVRMLAVKMGLRAPAGMRSQAVRLQERATPGTVESMIRVVPEMESSSLELSVMPDQPIYVDGQSIQFELKADRSGYLTIFAIGSIGDVTLLVPNRKLRSVMLSAGDSFSVPSEDMPFQFKIESPYGLSRIKAFLTPEPVVIPGSFDDRRDLMLSLVRESSIAADGHDPLGNPGWTCSEVSFMTGPSLTAP